MPEESDSSWCAPPTVAASRSRELADIRVVDGASIIARRDNQRAITVRTNIVGRDQGGFVEDAQRRFDREIKLPPGYRVTWGGQFENLDRARRRLSLVIPVTIAIIFTLLFFTFGSTASASLVLMTVPFSIVGGVLLLYLRDIRLSVSAAVGFISLFGVAVMSGVLYISEINRRRKEEDLSLEEAVIPGAKNQLRPCLILIVVALLGMLPGSHGHRNWLGRAAPPGDGCSWRIVLDTAAHPACAARALLPGRTEEDSAMRIEKKKCLMIFIEDTDTWKGERLYEVIVRLMHKRGLDGATAVSGITGFGAPGQIHGKGLFGVSDEKPIIIVAIDSEAKVKEAIDAVAPLVKEGLICTYDTEVFTPEANSGNQ